MSNRRGVDRRSPEAERYRRLYKGSTWKHLRKTQLTQHPLCERCRKRNRLTPATVVHHVDTHRGDLQKFYNPGNLESVCAPCHDSDALSEERLGYSSEVGADGWPMDPRHPQHRCAVTSRIGSATVARLARANVATAGAYSRSPALHAPPPAHRWARTNHSIVSFKARANATSASWS
jgi:hypothetical protein